MTKNSRKKILAKKNGKTNSQVKKVTKIGKKQKSNRMRENKQTNSLKKEKLKLT